MPAAVSVAISAKAYKGMELLKVSAYDIIERFHFIIEARQKSWSLRASIALCLSETVSAGGACRSKYMSCISGKNAYKPFGRQAELCVPVFVRHAGAVDFFWPLLLREI